MSKHCVPDTLLSHPCACEMIVQKCMLADGHESIWNNRYIRFQLSSGSCCSSAPGLLKKRSPNSAQIATDFHAADSWAPASDIASLTKLFLDFLWIFALFFFWKTVSVLPLDFWLHLAFNMLCEEYPHPVFKDGVFTLVG